MLKADPETRPSAETILEKPFLQEYLKVLPAEDDKST